MSTWQDDAACIGTGPEAFFPELGSFGTEQRMAQAICWTCPVRSECLDAAMENGDDDGIWGGLTPTARRKMRREQRRVA